MMQKKLMLKKNLVMKAYLLKLKINLQKVYQTFQT